MLKIIKKYYNCFDVRISIFACIDSLEKALYWEEFGADYICVDVLNVNRNFKMLKKMQKGLSSAKLELLANVSCLKACPMIHTHANWNAHASNGDQNADKYIDYCILYCQKKELEDSSRYIKSGWIRPEDIIFYEQIGIEHFKLTERNIPTAEMVKRVKAYATRKYDGNLLDLVQGHGFSSGETISNLPNFDIASDLSCDDIYQKIMHVRGMGENRKYKQHIYIDNKKLDGFLHFFTENKCKSDCKNCNYCKKIADKVITEDLEVKKLLLSLYEQFENKFF